MPDKPDVPDVGNNEAVLLGKKNRFGSGDVVVQTT